MPLGSSRFMSLRPEHRSAEIGNTWLASSAWGTGANVEAKYLMLRRAFEEARLPRVEFKTEAANDRSRAALAALPRSSRESTASTWSSAAASGATRRGTA